MLQTTSGDCSNLEIADDLIGAEPIPALEVEHEMLNEAMEYWCKKGFHHQHAVSKDPVVLWCAMDLARLQRGYTLSYRAKVHVRYVESMSPDDIGAWHSTQGDSYGDECWYHNWDGKVASFGTWLGGGV